VGEGVAVAGAENGFLDRFGLGWRPDLSARILLHREQIDVMEVMADDYFFASEARVRSLSLLSSQVPVVLHGVSLGLASTIPVEPKRLKALSRVHQCVPVDYWSEHLAFVRAGGIEIGHLAAPPRSEQSICGTVRNVLRAADVVGAMPLLENIATLIDPPGSQMDEACWVSEILKRSGARMLLDLHNLFANAINFGFDPLDYLKHIPLDRVSAIHLSGGKWIRSPLDQGGKSEKRLLDDHLHDVPTKVYDLLEWVAQYCDNSLTVILERDGNYPAIDDLLAQLQMARTAVIKGRLKKVNQGNAFEFTSI
jgi:uncharacterized protein (UPF0276 family)